MKKITQTTIIVFVLCFWASLIQVSAQTSKVPAKVNADYSKQFINKVDQIMHHPVMENGVPSRRYNDLTMVIYDAFKHRDVLTPEAKSYLAKITARPSLDKTYEPETGYFRLWYTNTGADAVDQIDNNNNGIPDYVEDMAAAVETARVKYAATGFAFPPPDTAGGGNGKYNIYIASSAMGSGTYGFVSPVEYTSNGDNPNSPDVVEHSSAVSYMVMRSEYNNFVTPEKPVLKVIQPTISHEFLHSTQMGTTDMSGWEMEMDATWSEDWVYPGNDDNFQYFSGLFSYPEVALNWLNSEVSVSPYDDSPFKDHWYSTWLFERYLTERKTLDSVNGVFVKDVYYREVGYIADKNSPDSIQQYAALQAIDDELMKNYNSTFLVALKNFYIACVALTSNPSNQQYAFKRADDYRLAQGTQIKYNNTFAYSGTSINYSSDANGYNRMMRLGANFFQIKPSQKFALTVTPKSKDSLVVALVKMDSAANPTRMEVADAVNTNDNYKIEVTDPSSFSNYVLLIMNPRSGQDTLSTQYSITIDDNVTGIKSVKSLPEKVQLYNNYPNPFNPSTMIQFDLPKSMDISLEVYNVLGSKVGTIFKGYKLAGTYSMQYNASNLTSGIYFVRLQAGDMFQIRKITLLK